MLYDYSYIIIPIIAMITSQAIKTATDKVKGNFDPKGFWITYGGMPSSHTAFITSILTLVVLKVGLTSPLLGVAGVFAFLTIRDAVGFRNVVGKQNKLLNKIREKLSEKDKKQFPALREQMGHSPLEILGGAIWGIGLTYLLILL